VACIGAGQSAPLLYFQGMKRLICLTIAAAAFFVCADVASAQASGTPVQWFVRAPEKEVAAGETFELTI
jgi:hypothetical protein